MGDEKLEPGRISELQLPQFKAYIRPEDIEDFPQRDKKILLAMSLFEQKLDFLIQWGLRANEHLRDMERELGRLRRTQLFFNWKVRVVEWLIIAMAAGFIAALLRGLVGRMLGG